MWLNRRFSRWLTLRVPRAEQQSINHRNIFIVPSRFGFIFLLLTALLFLLGTNYQNNVITLVSYLLISFFISALLHSFYNLSGLSFLATKPLTGFVDTHLRYSLNIQSDKNRFNLQFCFSNNEHLYVNVAEIKPGNTEIKIPYYVNKRGQYPLARIRIFSEFGFGLFKTWTRLDFGHNITAYPKPLPYVWRESQTLIIDNHQQEDEQTLKSYQASQTIGHDEFHQLSQYQIGEPLSRVAWKHVARGQGWFTKQFQTAQSGKLQLDFDALPSHDVEQKLGWLSFAINACQREQIAFALKLTHQSFPFANSAEHTQQCLTALAKYQQQAFETTTNPHHEKS